MSNNVSEEVIAREQLLAKAHIDMDISVIDDILHHDYVILQPNGELETKEQVLASYESGKRSWEVAEVSELDVKSYGENVARVIGRWYAKGRNDGKNFDYQARFISIWVKERDSWKNISYQSVEL